MTTCASFAQVREKKAQAPSSDEKDIMVNIVMQFLREG